MCRWFMIKWFNILSFTKILFGVIPATTIFSLWFINGLIFVSYKYFLNRSIRLGTIYINLMQLYLMIRSKWQNRLLYYYRTFYWLILIWINSVLLNAVTIINFRRCSLMMLKSFQKFYSLAVTLSILPIHTLN